MAGRDSILWVGLASALLLSNPAHARCEADLDGGREVAFGDLLQLLAGWGPCPQEPGCPADLDGDETVAFSDLLILLAQWGPCPFDGVVATQLAGNSLDQFPFFEYVLAFNEGAGFEVALDPGRFPQTIGQTGDIYVVEAKTSDEWSVDPSLDDVTGGAQSAFFVAGTIQSNTFAIAGSAALSGDAGISLGVAYDIVIDFNANGILDDGDFIDGLNGEEGGVPVHGAYVVNDTTLMGPLAVTELTYSLPASYFTAGPSLVGENTFYPTDIESMGELPLVIVSLGGGENYTWYDHIGFHMASRGYVVMSHANNTGPGVAFAAISTLEHINAFLSELPNIAGGVLNGHVDADNIVMIGHARGAEGQVIAYDHLVDGSMIPAHPFTPFQPIGWSTDSIRLIYAASPVDFLGPANTNPHNVNFHLLVCAADSNVTGCASCGLCQSYRIHDRATGNRHAMTLHGVGHAWFYNSGGGNPFASGPCLLGDTYLEGEAQTHLLVLGHLVPLVERYARQNVPAKDFLTRQFERFHPIGAPIDNPCVVVDLMYRDSPQSGGFMIDDFQSQPSAAVSSSGGSVSFDVLELDEGLLDDANSNFTTMPDDPMNGMIMSGPIDDSRGIVFHWLDDSFLEFEIIESVRDFTDNVYLSFRAAQSTRHGLTIATLGDLTFTASLIDGAGERSSINLGAYGGGIEEPYQRTGCGVGAGWANEFETIRIRLTDFLNNGSDLDLSDIKAVRFEFGPSFGDALGRIGLDEIEVTAD